MNLLEMSLLRPLNVLKGLDKFPHISNFLMQNLKFDIKSDFKHVNKNPFIPYCIWKTESLGQDLGYKMPFCDQFATQMTENGICYSFKNK